MNNLSIKARALAGLDLRPGQLELELVPAMQRSGRLALDEDAVVSHIQSHGLFRTPLVHFHNGRSTTGLPRRRIPLRERAIRMKDSFLLTPRLLASDLARGRKAPAARHRAAGHAVGVSLLVSHTTGQIAGLLAGPGKQPERSGVISVDSSRAPASSIIRNPVGVARCHNDDGADPDHRRGRLHRLISVAGARRSATPTGRSSRWTTSTAAALS